MVRVVVASDDGMVYVGHFGDAPRYRFYELRGGSWVEVYARENPYRGEHEHHHEHHHGHGGEEHGKRRKILQLISGADILVATFFGPGGREYMERHGKKVVTVKPGTSIEEALRIVQEELVGEAQ